MRLGLRNSGFFCLVASSFLSSCLHSHVPGWHRVHLPAHMMWGKLHRGEGTPLPISGTTLKPTVPLLISYWPHWSPAPQMQWRLGNVVHLPSSRISLLWEEGSVGIRGQSQSLPQTGIQSLPQPASIRGVTPFCVLGTGALLHFPSSSSEKPSLITTTPA